MRTGQNAVRRMWFCMLIHCLIRLGHSALLRLPVRHQQRACAHAPAGRAAARQHFPRPQGAPRRHGVRAHVHAKKPACLSTGVSRLLTACSFTGGACMALHVEGMHQQPCPSEAPEGSARQRPHTHASMDELGRLILENLQSWGEHACLPGGRALLHDQGGPQGGGPAVERVCAQGAQRPNRLEPDRRHPHPQARRQALDRRCRSCYPSSAIYIPAHDAWLQHRTNWCMQLLT